MNINFRILSNVLIKSVNDAYSRDSNAASVMTSANYNDMFWNYFFVTADVSVLFGSHT